MNYFYAVNIIDRETGETVEKIKCENQRKAEKVIRGVNINLNHERYMTEIVKLESRND